MGPSGKTVGILYKKIFTENPKMRFAKVDTTTTDTTTTNKYRNIPGFGWYDSKRAISVKVVKGTQIGVDVQYESTSEEKALEFTDITESTTSKTNPEDIDKQTRDSASMAPGITFGYRDDKRNLSELDLESAFSGRILREFQPKWDKLGEISRYAILYKEENEVLQQRLIGYSPISIYGSSQSYFFLPKEGWKDVSQ